MKKNDRDAIIIHSSRVVNFENIVHLLLFSAFGAHDFLVTVLSGWFDETSDGNVIDFLYGLWTEYSSCRQKWKYLFWKNKIVHHSSVNFYTPDMILNKMFNDTNIM